MSNSQLTLEILIKTIADTRGIAATDQQVKALAKSMSDAAAAGKPLETSADAIATSLQKSGKEFGKFGEVSKQAGKTFGELNRAGAGASQILNGLERAAQGGIQGIFGLANATRGFIAVARAAVASTGPVGILVTVLGLAAGAFLSLRNRTQQTGDEFEKTSGKIDGTNKALEQTAKAADEVEKQLKELADKGLTEATNRAKQLEDGFNRAAESIKRTAAAAAKVRAAETDLELARIDAAEAGGKLSKEDAEAARFTVQREATRGDLRAQQQLADDLITTGRKHVDAVQQEVNRKTDEGLRLADQQNAALARRSELNAQAGQIRDAARAARDQRDTEIEAMRRERALLQKSGDPRLDAGITARQRDLDSRISMTETTRDKEQSEFAAKITPIAQAVDAVNAELAALDRNFAETNAALQSFRDKLKEVASQTSDREETIKQDIQTTTAVAEIKEEAQALRNPELSKAADKKVDKAIKSGGSITTSDGRSIEVRPTIDRGGSSGGTITTGDGRRVDIPGRASVGGEEAAIRAAGRDAANKISAMGKETVTVLKVIGAESDRLSRQIRVAKEQHAGG